MTTTQSMEYPKLAPILELVNMLPGPITTHAVIKPGPMRRYQGRSLGVVFIAGAGIRVEKDLRNEKIGFKIREAQLQKIPYMIVLGDKEVESRTLAVRKRRSKETRTVDMDAFLSELVREIQDKTLDSI